MSNESQKLSRRGALAALVRLLSAGAVVGLAPAALPALLAPRRGGVHPDPRPGVTAERVLPDARVSEKARSAYAAAREFPEVFDGIYCHCDCAERHGELRSLLSCFETEMPMDCGICSGEARLVGRLARRGKTLPEIREAVDERYG